MRTAAGAGVAIAAMAVIVSPYLYFALAHPNPIHEGLQPETYVADVENLLFPTPVTWFFSEGFADVSARFAGNLTEQLAYTPLPLLIVFLCAAFAFRRTVAGRGAGDGRRRRLRVRACGAHLTVGGVPTIRLPWQLAEHFPLIRLALPTRFVVYTALAVAVLASLWLGARPRSPWRWALIGLSRRCCSCRTRTAAGGGPRCRCRRFFADGTYQQYIAQGRDASIVIPYGVRGNSMYWQATTDRWFDMAGGYAAAVLPDPYARYPIVYTLYGGDEPANAEEELQRFVRDKGVTSIIVQRGYPGNWRELFSSLGVEPMAVDDVLLYRLRRA